MANFDEAIRATKEMFANEQTAKEENNPTAPDEEKTEEHNT